MFWWPAGLLGQETGATPPEYEVKQLGKAIVKGFPPSDSLQATALLSEAPAGLVGLAHVHSGPGFAYILEGEEVLEVDAKPVILRLGDFYYEEAGKVVKGRVAGDGPARPFFVQLHEVAAPLSRPVEEVTPEARERLAAQAMTQELGRVILPGIRADSLEATALLINGPLGAARSPHVHTGPGFGYLIEGHPSAHV